ncbi:hypothetical protein FLONG3_10796 [Fusarium longipes]|uniref:Uncharacterized protein n=1 Tax=Fusarium longipes TaxID=694270 RepID=A0A395RKJ7_9HYPO|nr:hypothetical protein FLONG3_10796 [Fusarium longipes]
MDNHSSAAMDSISLRTINSTEGIYPPSTVDQGFSETGMFTNPVKKELLSVSSFNSTIAGYFTHSYAHDGPRFEAEVEREKSDMEDVEEEFEGIWLDLQNFWDLLLRMQPNCIMSDAEYTKQAVDFLLDLSVARLLVETRPEHPVKTARKQLKYFRRRLRRLELLLRVDMNTCGNSPKLVCGCLVAVKRPRRKINLWTRLFGNSKSNQPGRSDDKCFSVRDVAGLLRLEDYLTHILRELEAQHGTDGTEDTHIAITALGFLDDEIKQFLPKRKYLTRGDVRYEWVHVLLHPKFRAAVVREVKAIVSEASDFRKKPGKSAHQEGCDHWVPAKPTLEKMMSFRDSDNGKNPLSPAFWKKDSKGGER